MKYRLCFLISFSWALSACQATRIAPTNLPLLQPSPTRITALTEGTGLPPVHATSTPTKAAPPSATPSPTLLPSPTGTTSPTPVARIGLKVFDPDVKPPIQVSHMEPLIAKSDETVKLKFELLCAYSSPDSDCRLNATLFVTYGEENDFTAIPLKTKTLGGMLVWPANLPATNADGEPFRYYLQIDDPQIGLEIRYPLEGTIDLFAAEAMIPVDLPAQKPVEPGELVLAVPWGSGPEAVGTQKREGYPRREGPSAMDVAENGRIALSDSVNKRVLVYDPKNQSFTPIPLPFYFSLESDLQFDRGGRLAILDGRGKEIEQPTVRIPQLYLLSSDGSIDKVAPVFVGYPWGLTKDLEVQDLVDWRLVTPFNPRGEANSRQEQRHRRNPPLPYRFVENLDPYVARFGDVEAGLAFEMHSVSPLGAITYFEKTPPGYVAIFHAMQIRAIWFDSSGTVLKDVTLPNDQYSEVNIQGQVAIDKSGSLYILGSTVRGIEVRFVKAP